MSKVVHCGTHGTSKPAFICAHLMQTLKDGAARGVIWLRDEDGCVNAYCDACDARLEAAGGEWTSELEAAADIKLICEECFGRVMSINGKTGLN